MESEKRWIKFTTIDNEKIKCKKFEIKNDTLFVYKGSKKSKENDPLYAYETTYVKYILQYKIPLSDVEKIQIEDRFGTIGANVGLGVITVAVAFYITPFIILVTSGGF
ncbi:hypothetical protein ACFLU5_02775 [Bacteroidota bacterium]